MAKNGNGFLVAKNKHLENWARGVVFKARQSGSFPQCGTCVLCDLPGVAHHEDYANPLDVIWLCKPHHRRRHQSDEMRQRVLINVDIDTELRRWVNIEAARQGLLPARIIEQAIQLAQDCDDAK